MKYSSKYYNNKILSGVSLKINIIIFVIFFINISACKKNCEKISDLPIVSTPIVRAENHLFKFKSNSEAENFLKKYPTFSEKYFLKSSFPHDSLLAKYLVNFYSNKELLNLKKSTDSTFGDLKILSKDLNNLVSHVKYYYPDFFVPTFYTLISGFQFDKDIVISDSIIAISLDYFLGRTAKYRPSFYNYFLERYEKEYIVPMISLGISNKFNEINLKDETMLGTMIYYGKAYFFAKEMLPCTHDSLIIQYSGTQLKEINENMRIIWGHFIEHKLLYETKPLIIEKYLGERPKVNEIGDKCPGRIGRWLELEIVKKYMEENKNITLKELMAEKDAQKIFLGPKFKPGID